MANDVTITLSPIESEFITSTLLFRMQKDAMNYSSYPDELKADEAESPLTKLSHGILTKIYQNKRTKAHFKPRKRRRPAGEWY